MKKDSYTNLAQWYNPLLERLTSGLREIGMKMRRPKEGLLVLDIGCGTGLHLDLYQKAGCRVFGIDMSPSMLAVARERLGNRANLLLGNASHMPYTDGTFDLILLMFMLHEIPASVRSLVVKEAVRVLKKRGRILVIDYALGPLQFPQGWFYKSLLTVIEFSAGQEHFRNYRHFLAYGGLAPLIAEQRLSQRKTVLVGGGTIQLTLLSPETLP